MAHGLNTFTTDNINKYQSIAPASVLNAVKNASDKTGVNFSYLMEKASAESSFDTNAKAKTSSATGLYQFIDKTWLSMIKEHGEKYGLEKFANAIGKDFKVEDKAIKQEILDLRKDSEISALMAAEFTKENQNHLEKKLGRKANATDLYMAHFLGAGGATKFLQGLQNNPNKDADDLLPKAAKANKAVFYDKTDNSDPRSIKEIYAMFTKKFAIDNTPKIADNAIVVAENTVTETKTVLKQYHGRISSPSYISTGNKVSSETIFAMSEMASILYDLSTDRANSHEDKYDDDENFPTSGFFA